MNKDEQLEFAVKITLDHDSFRKASVLPIDVEKWDWCDLAEMIGVIGRQVLDAIADLDLEPRNEAMKRLCKEMHDEVMREAEEEDRQREKGE